MVLTIFVSVDSSPRPFGPRAAGANLKGLRGACQRPDISQQSILKQGFQKTHFPTVPISILTWFFRHLNMAFLGYFT